MRKIVFLSLAAFSVFSLVACREEVEESTTSTEANMETENSLASNYTDLGTGQTVELTRDASTGYVVNAATGDPVEFYIDMNTMDTFYGRTGTVVNEAIIQTDDGDFELDESKIEWDGEEMKVKEADGSKLKVEGDESKYKSGTSDYKSKDEGDESKVKTNGTTIKTDEDGTKVEHDD